LARQSYRNFELVIVDGFSTDGSLEVIDRHRSRVRVKLVFSGTRNFGYLRNLGQRFAWGDIVIQSNSDCYFPPR
ncbi:MAG: glycosyltransferase, partial [Burkholderiales bacterium]|nr:glycosyltransferase [Burkholderiales bacterium]